MFGIGFLEICIIILVALIFIGPKKLPELMIHAGKLFVQLRRMSNEVKSTFDHIIEEAEEDLDRRENHHMAKKLNRSKKSRFTKASFVDSKISPVDKEALISDIDK